MKSTSHFVQLSPEDQQAIFNLCEQHHYNDVLPIIARPRSEGGFGIHASYSSLRRFYIAFNPVSRETQTLEQYAEALQINRQHANGSFYSAILALVETKILSALKDGRPIADLDKEFKTLARLQRSFLAQEEWRLLKPGASSSELDQFMQESEKENR